MRQHACPGKKMDVYTGIWNEDKKKMEEVWKL